MANLKKSQKFDRNRKSGQNLAYKSEHRHEKSHVRRIRRHIARYGRAADAEAALMKYATALGLKTVQSAQEFIRNAKQAA